LQAVANNIKSYGIKATDPDVLQYYEAYCSKSITDEFEKFSTDAPDERKKIPELKKCFKIYFLPSISSDDL
jgi:hypothetical protein